ncbi:AAA family ATPase [Pseudomonas sp. NPDC090202]|uniref:AAA family ATPase n=1 Tax=unclassified Pseudomonas TaxID=196821 RepID=UPI0037FFD28F
MSNYDPTLIRPYPVEQHPVVKRQYLLSSDPISHAWEHLDKAIRRRSGGLVFWGMYRAGKSKMIEYLELEAKSRYRDLPTAKMDAEVNSYASPKEFYVGLCNAVGASAVGTAGECKRQAIQRMVEQGKRNPPQVYLLFIDEPQRWTDLQLTWLCQLFDKLEESNVRLIAVLVGQRELLTFRKLYLERGNGVIITRLMNTINEFMGLRSINEVAYVLQGYDTLIESDPDWPSTRFFFPRAYARGFRLEDCATVIWQAFTIAIDSQGRFTECRVPMKYLTGIVEILFSEYYELDDESFQLKQSLVDHLLSEVFFFDYLTMADVTIYGRIS